MYLQSHGATVEISDDDERKSFRAVRGIPEEASSCHTAIVDGYAIEGHVPVEAIRRLLVDRPDVIGLALPGMPADSPGMGGDSATWAAQPVVIIAKDGTLVPYT